MICGSHSPSYYYDHHHHYYHYHNHHHVHHNLYKNTHIGIYDQGSAREAFFTLTEERSVK